MDAIKLEDLTPEQRQKLHQEMEADRKHRQQKAKENKEAYKDLADKFVENNIDTLTHHKEVQTSLIDAILDDFKIVRDLKEEVYGVKINKQDSHTSTLKDGSSSITVGRNVTIKFDGTENAGVEKIKEFIKSLSTDNENAQKLAKIVDKKLKVNQKTGFLNPSSIIDLNTLKEEFNDDRFTEGLEIITQAQIRTVNSTYVAGWKNITKDGITRKLEFRFTI